MKPFRGSLTSFLLLGALSLALITLCAAAAPELRVFAVDGLQRVRPHDPPSSNAEISIKAARNEYEPFQIVVHAGSDGLKNVNVQLSDLKGRHGVIESSHISLYREHYIEVTKPTPKSKEGAGWYPDALIPFISPIDGQKITSARFIGAPFEVPPNSNQPVWIDVFVPKSAQAGNYSGKVTVTAAGQRPVTVKITLTVWNFTLPDRPSMRSNFGGFGSRIAKTHKVQDGSPESHALERRYAQILAGHRLCPPIPHYLMPKIKDDGSIDPTETHAALKEWIETFHVTGFPLDLIGNDQLGKDRDRNIKHLQETFAYLKANGWEKLAYIYVLDEPNDAAAYEEVRKRAKLIHETQPGIKVLCTEQPTPQEAAWGTLVGSVDIWVPLWTLFDEKAAEERLAAGEELWSYTALCQGGNGKDTPYWEINFPLLDYRIPAWTSWRYNITGLLYWTTVYWEKAGDVWTNPKTYGEGSAVFNGEGSLLYPGIDAGFAGPVASIRLKQIREGLEDYEYLNLLNQQGKKTFADGCAKRLAESWTHWDENPADLYKMREEIAKQLNEDK